MNAADCMWGLLRASGWLSLGAVGVVMLARGGRWPVAAARGGMLLVLVAGWSFWQWPVEIPYRAPVDFRTSPRLLTTPESTTTWGTAVAWELPSASGKSAASAVARPWSWAEALLVGWLLGMVGLVVRGGWQYACLGRALRAAVPAPAAWRQSWLMIVGPHLAMQAPLLVHERLGPLLARGPRGYAVVVPRWLWQGLNEDERTAILRHEAAHLRRGDIWKGALARLLALPQWFNPLAGWLVRRFEALGEWQADRAVWKESPTAAPVLARALLLAAAGPRRAALLAAAAANGGVLSERVERILFPVAEKESVMRRGVWMVAPLLLVAAAVVRFELVAQQTSSEPPKTLLEVKERAKQLEERLAQVKERQESRKQELTQFEEQAKEKLAVLKTLAEKPEQLGAETRRRVELLKSGQEASQLEAIKDALLLGDEGLLILAGALKDSPHEKARRQVLDTAVSVLDSGGLAVLASGYDKLPVADKVYLAAEVAKQGPTKTVLLLAMAKDAPAELRQAILKAGADQGAAIDAIAAVAAGADAETKKQLVTVAAALPGDDGSMLLYAGLKSGDEEIRKLIMPIAIERKEHGLVLLAGAAQAKEPAAREDLVRALRQIGGPLAEAAVQLALATEDPELRAAAERGAKD